MHTCTALQLLRQPMSALVAVAVAFGTSAVGCKHEPNRGPSAGTGAQAQEPKIGSGAPTVAEAQDVNFDPSARTLAEAKAYLKPGMTTDTLHSYLNTTPALVRDGRFHWRLADGSIWTDFTSTSSGLVISGFAFELDTPAASGERPAPGK